MFTLYFDGSSIGNPGKGGAGAVLYQKNDKENEDDKEIWTISRYLGENITNNVAEYNGLLLGIEECVKRGIKKLNVKGDSLLVINQMKGVYKVNAPHLKELYNKAKEFEKTFDEITFTHVYRSENTRADYFSTNY
jgi:ribonuclease HI